MLEVYQNYLNDAPSLFRLLIGVFSSGLYFFGIKYIGTVLLKTKLFYQQSPLDFAVLFAIGAAIQCIFLTLLVVLMLAYKPIILIFWLAPAYLALSHIVKKIRHFEAFNFKYLIDSNNVFYLLMMLILVFYVFVFCFIDFYGADISIYHLAIPRGVIWDQGYVFNPFFFGAGVPAGWHVFGVPVFLIGQELGYLGLTFWAFLGIGNLVYRFFKDKFREFSINKTLLLVLTGYFVVVVFLRDSLPNNDLPTMYLELSLGIFIYGSSKNNVGSDWIVGLLSGFILCIKAQSIFGVVMLVILYLIKKDKYRLSAIVRILVSSIFLSLIWPIIDIINYGSPLPLMIPGLKIVGEPWLPQYLEANHIIEIIHGRWYEANVSRLLSITFLPVLVMFLGNLFNIVFWKKFDKKLQFFLKIAILYSIIKVLILFLITLRVDILFNDRYHLVSYFLLTITGAIGWLKLTDIFHVKFSQFFMSLIFSSLFFVGIIFPYTLFFPDGDDINEPSKAAIPSIIMGINNQIEQFNVGSYWRKDPVINFIRTKTKSNEIIATIKMGPYGYNRHYFQLLPMTQSAIDLSDSPAILLRQLQRYNISYLHLTNNPGLVPGVTPLIQKWLKSLNGISTESGVIEVPLGDLLQGEKLYKLPAQSNLDN